MNKELIINDKYIIRDFNEEDYPIKVSINNIIFPEHPETEEEIRFWYESLDKNKYIFKRYAVDRTSDNKTVAFAYYKHGPEIFHPLKFWFYIMVHPDFQRQGIGTALYNLINQDLEQLNAINLRTWVKEDMEVSVSFVTKRGFFEKMREWESRLDVQKFNLQDFQPYLSSLYQQGLTISTFKEEKENTPGWDYKLYELDNDIFQDVPLPDTYTPESFEEYEKNHLNNPNRIPEAYFIVKDGDKYAGRTSLSTIKASLEKLSQGLTGVRREYRRRGIAMAVKVKAIEWAQKNGYKTIITGNDSENVGMLSINIKLGFQRQPAWITFEKDLTKEP